MSLCVILRYSPTICHILTALTNDAILAENVSYFIPIRFSRKKKKKPQQFYQVYNLDFCVQEL